MGHHQNAIPHNPSPTGTGSGTCPALPCLLIARRWDLTLEIPSSPAVNVKALAAFQLPLRPQHTSVFSITTLYPASSSPRHPTHDCFLNGLCLVFAVPCIIRVGFYCGVYIPFFFSLSSLKQLPPLSCCAAGRPFWLAGWQAGRQAGRQAGWLTGCLSVCVRA